MNSHYQKSESHGARVKPSLLRRFVIRMALLFAAALALCISAVPQATAAGILILVDSTGDGVNMGSGDVCDDGTGHCTLRAAIQLVDGRNNGSDGIVISVTGTINLGSVLPNLSVPVSISGPGPASLTVARNASIFRIFNVTTGGTVNISGMTISNGLANGGGGGIENASTGVVNLTNCTISGNQAPNGGGIFNAGNGRIYLTNCLVSNNTSQLSNGASYGGGIDNPNGYVNITSSTVSGNTAHGGTDVGEGGGVYNNGTLIIANSTFFSNTATSDSGTGFGGAVFNFGQLQITNSTILSNNATSAPEPPSNFSYGVGGGVYNLNTAVITNSTIAYNSSAGGTINQDAGGIQTDSTATHMQVKSCIIAKNIGSGPDVSGAFTSGGFNLIGATDGSTGFAAVTDQTGTEASPLDPEFDNQLANNGGPTQTLGLLSCSPAIDKGTSNGLTGTLTTDQRGTGFARIVDDGAIPNASGGDGTDIGAFEYGAGPVLPTSVVSRKFHGTGSTPPHFDVPLSLSCPSLGIECRRNTGGDTTGPNVGHDHELIVTFPSNVTVTVGSADVVDVSTGFPVGSATLSASNNVVTVDLHGLNFFYSNGRPVAYRLAINLRNVSDGTNSGLVSIPMGILFGDVNATYRTDSGDVTQVRFHTVSIPTDNATARFDVNLSNRIDSGDVTATRNATLTVLP
jgi:hypothetical protein